MTEHDGHTINIGVPTSIGGEPVERTDGGDWTAVAVPAETYRRMASIVRGWDLWLLTHRTDDALFAENASATEAFTGSEAGSRMEEPLGRHRGRRRAVDRVPRAVMRCRWACDRPATHVVTKLIGGADAWVVCDEHARVEARAGSSVGLIKAPPNNTSPSSLSGDPQSGGA